MSKGARIAELFANDYGELPSYHQQLMQLGEMIDRIERSVSHSLQYFAHRSGLPFIDSQVLAAAYELDDDARPSVIAERIRVPLSTMTGVVARLERSELVARKRASDDGRAYVLQLTPKGEQLLKDMIQPLFEELSVVISDAGEEALQSISAAFGQVCTMTEMLEQRIQERPKA